MCLILLRARDVTTNASQSRLGLCPACVTISTMSPFCRRRAQRHHLPVDARADALVADVGVHRVREVHRGRAPRQRPNFALRREDVDLLRVEVDLQVLEELLRVAHFLLHFEQLPHPLEVPLVAIVADAAFLVLPVRGECLLRRAGASPRCGSALRTGSRAR